MAFSNTHSQVRALTVGGQRGVYFFKLASTTRRNVGAPTISHGRRFDVLILRTGCAFREVGTDAVSCVCEVALLELQTCRAFLGICADAVGRGRLFLAFELGCCLALGQDGAHTVAGWCSICFLELASTTCLCYESTLPISRARWFLALVLGTCCAGRERLAQPVACARSFGAFKLGCVVAFVPVLTDVVDFTVSFFGFHDGVV